ncbi:mechanosensitive ion channel [Actimicrobium sp. CCC2.4]|uniref:mechanosensitive ion channel family protein n=1 Tax=Actimicrobium sp. CCC2.4 TaxID=3048606 RepID=UPI002AC93C05|nr:mechanosensitive ion channel domain-containing protein [Actimicrobium sp. CCC2.4]MEB0137005.1 mechanosensitive ion channel [Actimicrobium sp. CCC2.4]WPX32257.1 mechanosensitive ion channel [Actimicrobium sp. CCC2.4]
MNDQIKHLIDILTGYLLSYGINVIGAIVTLIIGTLVAGWVARLIDRAMRRSSRIDPVFHYLPGKIVRVAILIFTLVAVLNRFGVETTSLIAVLGAAGLAVGLALQGTLSNVAAGVMILFFRPFKIGDVVQLDSQVYIIDAVGFFICKGHLPDGPAVFIPNSKIWGQTIVNLSVTDNDIRRIDEGYGIAYTDSIPTALAILQQIAAADPRILATPAPLIKVDKLGDSSVNILFRVWTSRSDWWDTKLDLVQRCKEGLEAGGCSLPYPQRDVHHFHEAGAVRKTGMTVDE